MKRIGIYFVLLVLFFSFSVEAAQKIEKIPAHIAEKHARVLALKTRLQAAVASAEKKKIDTSREKTAISLANIFLPCSVWDANNEKLLESYFDKWISGQRGKQFERRTGINYDSKGEAKKAPQRILDQLEVLLKEALENLSRQTSKEITRPEYKRASMQDVKLLNGYARAGKRPIFLAHVKLAHQYPDEYLPVDNFAGYSVSTGHIPEKRLIEKRKNDATEFLDFIKKDDMLVNICMNHGPPSFAVEKHPEILHTMSGHMGYDIDNPYINGIIRQIIDYYLPPLEPASSRVFSIGLATEPAWNSSAGALKKTKISKITYEKWRTHLKKKYKKISELNRAWETNFKSFDDIKTHDSEKKHDVQWYDWCRFNQLRVTEWFAYLQDVLQKYFPGVPCHITLVNERTICGTVTADAQKSQGKIPNRHSGLDREALINLMGINGCDTRILPGNNPVPQVEHPWSEVKNYSIQWLGQSMAFDFQKSLAPNKLIYDSEWHSVQTLAYHDPDISSKYMTAATWFAHIYGMGANNAYVWTRDGVKIHQRHTERCFGSLSFSPRVLNAYMQALIDLNALAPHVEAVARGPRQVGILYSDASTINNINWQNNALAIYEAITFLGLKVEFITENMLAQGKGDDHKWMIIPSANCVKDSTIKRLDELKSKGVKLSFIGSDSLTRYENSQKRTKPLPESLRNIKPLQPCKVQDMMEVLAKEKPASLVPSAHCVDKNGKPAFGVISRAGKIGKEHILFVINTLKEKKTFKVKVAGKAMQIRKNLLTGKLTKGDAFTLQPDEFRFIHCK